MANVSLEDFKNTVTDAIPITKTIIPLTAQAVIIAPHVEATLKEIGIAPERVQKKAATVFNNPSAWKPVEKWAMARKVWEKSHSKHVFCRTCYANITLGSWTLSWPVFQILSYFVKVVAVEITVERRTLHGVEHAVVTWYEEGPAQQQRPKPR